MISIVTAYYNRKSLFIRTLNSLMIYYCKIDFEVIAADDGSDEDERLEDLLESFPFLRIIRIEKSQKWYQNSCIPNNLAIGAAKGDILIIQNPECFHHGNILQYVKNNIRSGEYFSFATLSLSKELTENNQLFTNKDEAKVLIQSIKKGATYDGELSWYNHSIYRPVGFHFCCAIMKKDLKLIGGGFDERFAMGIGYDDDEFLWRIKKHKIKLTFIDQEIVFHQYHYRDRVYNNEWQNKLDLNRNIFNSLLKSNSQFIVRYINKIPYYCVYAQNYDIETQQKFELDNQIPINNKFANWIYSFIFRSLRYFKIKC